MDTPVKRATLFALYQFSIVVGIVTFPVALLCQRVGLRIPVHRLIDRLGSAYEGQEGQAT